MSTSSTSSKIRSSDLKASLDLFEVKPGLKFSRAVLADLLPDAETVLFFGKVYDLDYQQLSALMDNCISTDLSEALFGGDHSTELQDYLLDGYVDEDGDWHDPIVPKSEQGRVNLSPDVAHGEILPAVWEMLEVVVAQSIKDVAAKLENIVGLLPGKQGKMLFQSMLKLNAKRPTLGDYRAKVQHDVVKENLVILDVSGSMSEQTVRTICEDVVALSYTANAHMAIVSENCFYWAPGTYGVIEILEAAEYRGTHYEQLTDLFDGREWGTVITVADYDSSPSAKSRLGKCTSSIDQVIDISLVNRPSYLAECVGQMASSVQPCLVGRSRYIVGSRYDERAVEMGDTGQSDW